MKIGTKSVLFGAHCFFLHPFYVAAAWTKLYGFPWDPRLWVAFFLHDIGYLGKPNMDGPEGEKHVEFGANAIGKLFDRNPYTFQWKEWFHGGQGVPWRINVEEFNSLLVHGWETVDISNGLTVLRRPRYKWHDFCLYHSRHYAKMDGAKPSRLCFADKLAFCYQIKPLYLWMTKATGELDEYLRNAKYWNKGEYVQRSGNPDASRWYDDLCVWIKKYVEDHKDGAEDKVTVDRRVSDTAY